MNYARGCWSLQACNATLLTDIIRRALLLAVQEESPERSSEADASAPFHRRPIYEHPFPDHSSRQGDAPGAAR